MSFSTPHMNAVRQGMSRCRWYCTTRSHRSLKEQGLTQADLKVEKVDYVTMDMRPPSSVNFEADAEKARKRLQYQTSKRGMLEMDALLGTYARRHLETMDVDELKQWNDILRQYDNDLYTWLIRRNKLDEIPEELQKSPVFQDLSSFAKEKGAAYAEVQF